MPVSLCYAPLHPTHLSALFYLLGEGGLGWEAWAQMQHSAWGIG